MSIYNRDNINYSQMIQNAIANRNSAAQRKAAYDQAKGKLWGETTTNIGNMIGRGIGGYNAWKGDTSVEDAEDAELEMLKKKLEEYEAQQAEADAYHGQVEHATNYMTGYKPNDYLKRDVELAKNNMNGYQPNMTGYKPNDYFKQEMVDSYDKNYNNPYNLALMEGVYRRGR